MRGTGDASARGGVGSPESSRPVRWACSWVGTRGTGGVRVKRGLGKMKRSNLFAVHLFLSRVDDILYIKLV